MRLTPDVYVVGGGRLGFGISGPGDCHVYLLRSGDELALVDTGVGLPGDLDRILANIRADDLDPSRIRKLILTHYHTDHIGAAAELKARLGVEIYASPLTARALWEADEKAVSLDVARSAGFYPADYRLAACAVEHELTEGDTLPVGGLTLRAYETPGHCDGHLSYLVSGGERTYLMGGDLVFWGGKISLQTIHDCRVPDHAASMFKIEGLAFDALLPGHLQIALADGRWHVAQAANAFRSLSVPPNIW
jgi:glyoxylase-like metal-dependent hydrolase (beta-lactamase superfamily II)